MIAPDRIAAVVLAAGAARRFGSDKLLHPLDGRPLAAHIAETLAGLPLAGRFAVVPQGNTALADVFTARGFDIIVNPDPGQGLSSSLGLGAGMAAAHGVDALLLCLGDMPFVTREHLSRLIAMAGPEPVATRCGAVVGPPAIFPATALAGLMALAGDSGARSLLTGARLVDADPTEVRDIDVVADLPPGDAP